MFIHLPYFFFVLFCSPDVTLLWFCFPFYVLVSFVFNWLISFLVSFAHQGTFSYLLFFKQLWLCVCVCVCVCVFHSFSYYQSDSKYNIYLGSSFVSYYVLLTDFRCLF